jgi:arylsulfatase A-like enzyme
MAHNIVCIIADDHRASALGRFGREPVNTPHLDGMAAEGCHFRQLRIEGGRCRAVCIPTRASLITGCSVAKACEDVEGRALKPNAPMLPAVLRQSGYHCEIIGKWHQDIPSLHRGFDNGSMIFTAGMGDHHALAVHNWESLERGTSPEPYLLKKYSSEAYGDATVEFLRKREALPAQPFYLQVGLSLPHDPFDPPPGWVDPPEERLPPLPPDFQPRHPFDIGDIDVRDEQLLPWPRPPLEVRRMAARYYAMIGAIDTLVGRVRKALEESGLADNTVVLYTGDHGLCGGRHGLLGKQSVYDAALRIPGIMCGPGVPAGRSIDALASQLDLSPTLLDFAQCGNSMDDADGCSLRPVMENSSGASPGKFHFARYRHYQRAITDGRHKLIATRVDGDLRLQWFDLNSDPDECHDLVGNPECHPNIRKMVEVLNRYLRRGNDPDFACLEASEIQKLLVSGRG